MMCAILFVVACFVFGRVADAASTYDQSQTGELNVQVALKDLQIIALMKSGKEEYVDYDYAYDYSEMTIKPQNGTTSKPQNATSTTEAALKVNATTTPAPDNVETSTESLRKSSTTSLEGIVQTEPSVVNLSTTTLKSSELTTKQYLSAVSEATITTTVSAPVSTNSTNCKKGFIHNLKGGCELKLQSASNALLKIIKLSQKLKRRENRKDGDEK